MTTHHFVKLDGGVPTDVWIGDDYAVVEAAMIDAWDDLKSLYRDWMVLDQMRWYRDGPAFHPAPSEGNPAARVTEFNNPGTHVGASTHLPPQCAWTITERTTARARWGRFYWPAGLTTTVDAVGLIGTTTVELLADTFETFFNTCRAAELVPVVWSPTVESAFSVDTLQVDDLVDIIRSRRWSSPSLRDTRALAALP